jgi:hypothetical protein
MGSQCLVIWLSLLPSQPPREPVVAKPVDPVVKPVEPAKVDPPRTNVGSVWPTVGYVPRVARWAQPSDTGHYVGYYVGGGAPWCGSPRYRDEGTWGWDYGGLWLRKRVMLDWFHGRYQGGTGAYRTDGPQLVPLPKSQ